MLGLCCCMGFGSSCSFLWCVDFSLWWSLSLQSMGSRCSGFSRCCAWAQWLWCMGLVIPRHVGSSWTRDRTRVSCLGRTLYHWATRVAPHPFTLFCLCCRACESLFPWPGIELRATGVKALSPNHWITRKFPMHPFTLNLLAPLYESEYLLGSL